jgi:hypothetical protein
MEKWIWPWAKSLLFNFVAIDALLELVATPAAD